MTTIPDHTTVELTTTAFTVTVAVTTRIDASAERCWDVLADTDSYPSWNPFIQRFDGALVVGDKIGVELHLDGRKPQSMSPKLVEVTTGRSFEWLGGFGVRGIFDGRHRFEIEPLGNDDCRLLHTERLSGILVPAFEKMLTGPTPAAFVAMNTALKQRAEES